MFAKAAKEVLADRDGNQNYGVLCCDINAFQKLNFHYGVSSGNEILRLYGGVLSRSLAYQGLACRVKGDYFILLFQYKEYRELLKTLSQMMREMTI